MTTKAIVRQHLERIDGVSRTWFEHNLETIAYDVQEEDEGGKPTKRTVKELVLVRTLVVEVDFDTDPNNSQFNQNVLDAIVGTARGVQENETGMSVSNLKIVPKSNAS